MNSHEIDYELIGDDMQIVEIELDPGAVSYTHLTLPTKA